VKHFKVGGNWSPPFILEPREVVAAQNAAGSVYQGKFVLWKGYGIDYEISPLAKLV
jgi:hypothetical protein